MRPIVTLTTAAAFVLHFLFGCCAHHAHAAEGTVCSGHAVTAEYDLHHDGCDHSSQQPGESSPGNSECPAQHCSEGHCVFMGTGKTVVAKAALHLVMPLFVVKPAVLVPLSAPAASALDSGGLITLPVRTHLFNQVLLI